MDKRHLHLRLQHLHLICLKELSSSYYQEDIDTAKAPLLDSLIVRNKMAAARGGNFVGYGERQSSQDIAQQQFLSGVENIYSDVSDEIANLMEYYVNS